MKNLIILSALLATLGVEAATCGKVGHRSYPQDEQSKIIADKLNVKTCDGERFQNALTALGLELTYVEASQELQAKLKAETEEKRASEIETIRQAL